LALSVHKEKTMHENRKRVAIILAAILAFAACGKEITRKATATASNENDVAVVFADGQSVTGIDDYEAMIAANPPPIDDDDSFEIVVSALEVGGPSVSVGKFKIRFFVSTEYLAGCVNQKMPHLVVQVTNEVTTLALVELHLAGWFSGKTPCLGLYNKSVIAYGFCLKGCFNNPKTGVKAAVKNGLIAAGVSGSVATILAALAAPVVVPALAL
jgi:hypothetical protein